jgi:energy-coupling factor transport system permease protein
MALLNYLAYQDSFIHRLDPRTKALWAALCLFLIFSTSDWRLLTLVLVTNLLLLAVARIPLRVLAPLVGNLILFGLVILVFQLLFQDGPVWLSLGPIHLHSKGFDVARSAWFRLANLAIIFAQYMMWTHPTDIALMLVRAGVSYRMAMMIGFALRSFPLLQREAFQIMDAQRVKGKPLDRAWQKIASLPNVMIPFSLRVLKRTTDIAVAMELRGFGYSRQRTFLREIRMRPVDWISIALMVVIASGRAIGMFGVL